MWLVVLTPCSFTNAVTLLTEEVATFSATPVLGGQRFCPEILARFGPLSTPAGRLSGLGTSSVFEV